MLPDSKGEVLKGADALMKNVKLTRNVTLRIANAIFLSKGFHLKDYYVESTKKLLSAEAQRVNFSDGHVAAEVIIDFCDKNTEHEWMDEIYLYSLSHINRLGTEITDTDK